MSLTRKLKVAKNFILNEKSYNKTVIDFNFGRHKDLSILKSDIYLGELQKQKITLRNIKTDKLLFLVSKYFFGCEYFVDIFWGSPQNWIIFMGYFYAF